MTEPIWSIGENVKLYIFFFKFGVPIKIGVSITKPKVFLHCPVNVKRDSILAIIINKYIGKSKKKNLCIAFMQKCYMFFTFYYILKVTNTTILRKFLP